MTFVGLKVEHAPEDPSVLAIEMAEAYGGITSSQSTIHAYEQQIIGERHKAKALFDLMFDVREKRRAGYVSTSRMDPMNTYDLDAMKTEHEGYKANAKMLQDLVTVEQQTIRDLQNKIPKLQRRIKTANAKIKENAQPITAAHRGYKG